MRTRDIGFPLLVFAVEEEWTVMTELVREIDHPSSCEHRCVLVSVYAVETTRNQAVFMVVQWLEWLKELISVRDELRATTAFFGLLVPRPSTVAFVIAVVRMSSDISITME